jgi:lipopolysaccharide transport system permease protein
MNQQKSASKINSVSSPLLFWRKRIEALRNNRYLIIRLFQLSLTEQFKRTFLGSLWLVLGPLLGIIIWLILNYTGLYNPGETGIPYPAYLLLSMTLWNFFTGFFRLLSTTVTESGRFLLEVPFQMEAKLAEKTLLALVHLAIPMALNIIVLSLMGISFSLNSLLSIPALLPLILLGMSIGIFISLIEVVFNDILLIAGQGMTLLMYLTPVVYSEQVNSTLLRTVIQFNPLTYLIGVPRNLLVGLPVENWGAYWLSAVGSALVFLAVVWLFFRSVSKIIERILE